MDPPVFQADAPGAYFGALPGGIRQPPPSSTLELEPGEDHNHGSNQPKPMGSTTSTSGEGGGIQSLFSYAATLIPSSGLSTSTNTTAPLSLSLELEPENETNEREGLMKTSTSAGFGNGNTTKQRSSAKALGGLSLGSSNASSSKGGGGLQQQITSLISLPSAYSIRNLAILGGLALLTFAFVDNLDVLLEKMTLDLEESGPDEYAGYSSSPHHTTFGGINNLAHAGGAKAAFNGQGLAFEPIIIPVANFGRAAKSVNVENIINHFGHYMHDEHRSPYASHLYDRPKEELDGEQDKFVEKMKKVRAEWGAWSFKDTKPGRPTASFSNIDYKDLPNSKLPAGSWQTDEEYVTSFIAEARSLIERVTEGIYAEYGSPLKKKDGTSLTQAELISRSIKWGPKIERIGDDTNSADPQGIATLSGVAFDGLVKKLLHALITNDEFYAVLGGHSAAAGHGNQFQQNKQITFHHLMEPVFDKLGVNLISRNMGQGGVGTLQFSIAGKHMYGEADIMEWDSAMTEKGNTVDLWNKQAILSGERVPVILNQFHFDIVGETDGTAMMGIMGTTREMVPETTDENQAKTLPYAAQWLDGKEQKYNAICWEPRSDITPLEEQEAHPGSQVSWHPGFRYHHFQGRKLALILLKALAAAMDTWEAGIKADGFPLAESYWHVGGMYNTIREKLRTHVNTPKMITVAEKDKADVEKDIRSPCENSFLFLPRVCRVAMSGFGMWEPRAHGDYDFLNIIHAAPNGYKPGWSKKGYYGGLDLLPYEQKIPDGEIDVHAIAIATVFPPPELDHDWVEDTDVGNGTSTEETPPNRRWLKMASEHGFRHKPTVIDIPRDDETKPAMIDSDAQRWAISQSTLPSNHNTTRRLGDEVVTPGRGWYASGWRDEDEFCDGSAQSTCNRGEHNKCMGIGHNDNHKEVSGSSLSGWLVFTVPKVKEGIILIRMEWWCGRGDAMTKGWTEVNDGKTLDETPFNATLAGSTRRKLLMEQHRHRQLKPTVDQLVPSDMKMDVAINGKITKTFEREEWISHVGEMSKNCAVWPILDDESMAKKDWKEGDEGEAVEVGIRFRIESNPHQGYCISHVYYA